MEAINFIKGYRKMCNKYINYLSDGNCIGCPLSELSYCNLEGEYSDIEKIVEIVEKWIKDNN